MSTKKRKILGPARRRQRGFKGPNMRLAKLASEFLRSSKNKPFPPAQSVQEMPSLGLSCTCFGKIHPDVNCPLHCADTFK